MTTELIERLRHPSVEVRLAAARALDHAPQTAEVERALAAASRDDPDPMVRKWCLHALACATCKPDGVCASDVVGAFVDAVLHDRSGKVRKFAAGMMMHGQLGADNRIVQSYRTLLHHDQRILRERAAFFLARHEAQVRA